MSRFEISSNDNQNKYSVPQWFSDSIHNYLNRALAHVTKTRLIRYLMLLKIVKQYS